ncbi:MAG TPA: hypothetical protein VHN36_15745, partial [Ilumatobacteraceae bacterium]|nr:hypothetical protein [Ilumatobacteraceae bacterium]
AAPLLVVDDPSLEQAVMTRAAATATAVGPRLRRPDRFEPGTWLLALMNAPLLSCRLLFQVTLGFWGAKGHFYCSNQFPSRSSTQFNAHPCTHTLRGIDEIEQ